MKHFASPQFWECFSALPGRVQDVARRNYELLKEDTHHPSLHFTENTHQGRWIR